MRLLGIQVVDYCDDSDRAYVTLSTELPLTASDYSRLEDANWVLHTGSDKVENAWLTTLKQGNSGSTIYPR